MDKDILNPSALDSAVGFKVGQVDSWVDVRGSKTWLKKKSSKDKCTTKPSSNPAKRGVFKRDYCLNRF